ncbi:hypothetical protein JB92DRAFT_2825522 [Gautieria morchelliformis]|nr:hypothetical protein JB92DRAFT_2825522 [Gautieria morchelliformis]
MNGGFEKLRLPSPAGYNILAYEFSLANSHTSIRRTRVIGVQAQSQVAVMQSFAVFPTSLEAGSFRRLGPCQWMEVRRPSSCRCRPSTETNAKDDEMGIQMKGHCNGSEPLPSHSDNGWIGTVAVTFGAEGGASKPPTLSDVILRRRVEPCLNSVDQWVALRHSWPLSGKGLFVGAGEDESTVITGVEYLRSVTSEEGSASQYNWIWR